MLSFFKSLFLLINIDQETVLNWFGIDYSTNNQIEQFSDSGYELDSSNFEPSTAVSFETFRLIIEGLWDKIQDGLTLADIETILFFILFIRFIILAFRYNLKSSFYITCIGIVAGYLWYRHLIDLIAMYRGVLLKLPFLHKLGMDAVQLRAMHRQIVLTDLKLGENTHWYNPAQVIYYAFTKGIINTEPETGFRYYIDPISMYISNLQESTKADILPLYYKIYNKIIPKIYDVFSKFWTQISGVAAYALITRVGKRYCPYLVRWHWTFLLIIGMVEQIFVYFVYRIYYFQLAVLIPLAKPSSIGSVDPNVVFQIDILNAVTATVVLAHMGFVIFGLFHAVWGQYFYFPFFVENTELHIGPRPKNSIYSGGQTAWQDFKKENAARLLPKIWYGWFGRGTDRSWNISKNLNRWFKKIFKKVKKRFQ
jgi:Uncharacterised protein family